MKLVRFNRSCAPYSTGEVAGFPDEKAQAMVDKGQASYVKEKESPLKKRKRSLGENRQMDAE